MKRKNPFEEVTLYPKTKFMVALDKQKPFSLIPGEIEAEDYMTPNRLLALKELIGNETNTSWFPYMSIAMLNWVRIMLSENQDKPFIRMPFQEVIAWYCNMCKEAERLSNEIMQEMTEHTVNSIKHYVLMLIYALTDENQPISAIKGMRMIFCVLGCDNKNRREWLQDPILAGMVNELVLKY